MTDFKAANLRIEANCKLISETMLLNVERKRMYDHLEFAAQQAHHHAQVQSSAQCCQVHAADRQAAEVDSFKPCSLQPEWNLPHEVCVCATDKQQAEASGEPACMLLSLGSLQAASPCTKLSIGTGDTACLLLCWGLQPEIAAEPFAPRSCGPFGDPAIILSQMRVCWWVAFLRGKPAPLASQKNVSAAPQMQATP